MRKISEKLISNLLLIALLNHCNFGKLLNVKSTMCLLATAILFCNVAFAAEPVKKSSTSICHAPGTKYYEQTKKFTPFKTLDDCLKSGGRLPKR